MAENICKQSNQQGLVSKIYKQLMQLNIKKNKQPNQKMGRKSKQIFLQRGHSDGPQTDENIFNIINYQRNTNQNYNEVSLYASQNGHHQKSTNNKCQRGGTERGTLLHCWWGCQLVTAIMENSMEVPQKPNNRATIMIQAIPLLSIYPEKTIVQKDICTLKFIAALFTIARTWKQPKCP